MTWTFRGDKFITLYNTTCGVPVSTQLCLYGNPPHAKCPLFFCESRSRAWSTWRRWSQGRLSGSKFRDLLGGWDPMTCNVVNTHGSSFSSPKDRVNPLRNWWLINGGDPNYLRYLGWSSKYESTESNRRKHLSYGFSFLRMKGPYQRRELEQCMRSQMYGYF